MDHLRQNNRTDKGSVLMEFLIVAPLYLLLFGGLMLTGELLLARLNLWNHDRLLAWTADDRHFSTLTGIEIHRVIALIKASFYWPDIYIDESGNSVIKSDHFGFENENILADEWVTASVNDETAAEQYVLSNFWGKMYNSQIPLKLNTIPASIRGPMSLIGILSGENTSFVTHVDFYQGGTHTKDRSHDRHYVVHRYLYDKVDQAVHDRKAEATDLLNRGILWNIVEEPWIKNTKSAVQGVIPPDDYDFAYERTFLSEWSE